MKERFEGAENTNRIDALKRQEFVSGDFAIAQALDKVGTVVESGGSGSSDRNRSSISGKIC